MTVLLGGERWVSDLAQAVGLSQSCTTRHLQALQREQVVRGERRGKRVVFHLCLHDPEVRALVAWAISERAGTHRISHSPSAHSHHGGDLHSERPRPGSRDYERSPVSRVRRRKPARRPAAGRIVDPSGVDAASESSQTNPEQKQAESPAPAPQRPSRQELEDFLL